MDITTALARVVDHIDLSTEEMQDVMRQIMTGQCTDAQIGGFLVALRMKSESLDEITGAALAMRELASGVSIQGEHLVDTCGTGGDGANRSEERRVGKECRCRWAWDDGRKRT